MAITISMVPPRPMPPVFFALFLTHTFTVLFEYAALKEPLQIHTGGPGNDVLNAGPGIDKRFYGAVSADAPSVLCSFSSCTHLQSCVSSSYVEPPQTHTGGPGNDILRGGPGVDYYFYGAASANAPSDLCSTFSRTHSQSYVSSSSEGNAQNTHRWPWQRHPERGPRGG